MTTAPILTAETILVNAIKSALTPYVGTYLTRPKAYYQQAEQNAPKPFVIFQAQSDIGRMDWVGDVAAETLITVKALADTGSGARTLLNAVTPGMAALTASGYTITARYERSPTIPPNDNTFQALHVYRVRIERT